MLQTVMESSSVPAESLSIWSIILIASSATMVGFAVFVCVYHLTLAVVAILQRNRKSELSQHCSHRFAILIPAHNEELGLPHTLDSCAHIDYPSSKFRIYVVADNCSDQTKRVAVSGGAVCLVRNDKANPGKGYALSWAIPRIEADAWDALLVLDADCRIDSHALRVFDAYMASGDKILQAKNIIANPDDSAVSYLLAIANSLENDLFDAPKSELGLATRLRGTGMVIHRQILTQIPWKARSVAEDAEYGYSLLEAHIPIRFVRDVRVASNSPSSYHQMSVQRTRWIGGIRIGMRRGLQFLRKGLAARDLVWLDTGFTSLIAGRFLVILQWIACMMLAVGCWLVLPGRYSEIQLWIALAVPLAYCIYVALGVFLVGGSQRRMWLLLQSPYVALRYLAMACTAVILSRASVWNRTPRQ